MLRKDGATMSVPALNRDRLLQAMSQYSEARAYGGGVVAQHFIRRWRIRARECWAFFDG